MAAVIIYRAHDNAGWQESTSPPILITIVLLLIPVSLSFRLNGTSNEHDSKLTVFVHLMSFLYALFVLRSAG